MNDCQDDAETRQVLVEAAQSFIETIEFYKKDFGDPMSHDEAVKETLRIYACRRQRVAGLQPREVTWGQIAALAEVNADDALTLWQRVRQAADDELETGKRGAEVAGHNANPYERARYLAIRDSFSRLCICSRLLATCSAKGAATNVRTKRSPS